MIKPTPIVTYEGGTNSFERVDYLEQAKDLTTSQFKDKDIFNRYLELLLSGKVDLQDVIQDLMQKRSLYTAEGAQLDVIGRIVGQPRTLFDSEIIRYFGFSGAVGASPYKSVNNTTRFYGPWKGTRDALRGIRELTDREYRNIILLKIIKNTSDANITAFNDGVRILFGIDEIDYQEDVPPNYTEGAATITISIGRDYNDPEEAAFPGLDEIALAKRFLNIPLGVGILFQDPITFYANFVTKNYRMFQFGNDGMTPTDFDVMFDFSRPYEADYYDSSGTLVTAAVDEPRYAYDPVTLDAQGLLIEGPDEILTHTWGLETNDSQGTLRVALTHNNPTAKEVAFITETEDLKMILFRENSYWKVRVEYPDGNYNMVLSQYTGDSVTATISYTPSEVFFSIEDESRYVSFSLPYGGADARGFDMRVGGTFTDSIGNTYDHFNGYLEQITYLRPYVGENETAVVDGAYITTEMYEKIISEFGEEIGVEV